MNWLLNNWQIRRLLLRRNLQQLRPPEKKQPRPRKMLEKLPPRHQKKREKKTSKNYSIKLKLINKLQLMQQLMLLSKNKTLSNKKNLL